MRKIISEPLFQFLAIGLLVHMLAKVLLPPAVMDNQYEIVVEEATLLNFMQTQAKTFQPQQAASVLAKLDSEQKARLIRDYVRSEVLFREAMAIALDKNDEIIRRRLIQKMEYVAQGFYDEILPLTKDKLREYYESNREDYRLPAEVTFTHVFISFDGRDDATAYQLANDLLAELNDLQVRFEKAGRFGERFLYNRNYAERTDVEVGSHFGEDFQRRLFDMRPNAAWQGPLQSQYGYHLVLLRKLEISYLPQFEQVIKVVEADAQRAERREIKLEAIDKLIEKYTVSERFE